MYFVSYAQGILACHWLAWLSSMFKSLVLHNHGQMWSVYRAGRISAFCIWYARVDFQYDCDVIILMFNQIDKWHITMTSHTRHGFQLTGNYTVCLTVRSGKLERKHKADLLWGEPLAMESPHTGPPKLHSSDPCDGNPLVNCGFTVHRSSNTKGINHAIPW